MKQDIHKLKIKNTNWLTVGILSFLLVVFAANRGFTQEETAICKTITSGEQCNQFNVQLDISGNPADRPIEVILVIDRSGSMDDTSPTPLSYAQDAAIEFANKVLNIDNPTGLNKVGVVSYSDYATLEIGLRNRNYYTNIVSEINGLWANGYTNIADGFIKAANELNTNATHDCKTIRAIVFLTDGIANKAPGCYSCTTWPTSPTCCTNAAISAGLAAQSYNSYETNVYTIGLFGAISDTYKSIARTTMQGAQNSGFWETTSGADLSGIYNQITNQLIWAAKDVVAIETVTNGFSIIQESISASKGSTSINGQIITWDIDAVYKETATLTYTVEANENTCSNQTPSTFSGSYENSDCEQASLSVTDHNICVPCLEITNCPADIAVSCSSDIPTPNANLVTAADGCGSVTIEYISDISNNESCPEIITRTYKATNECGDTKECIQLITIDDNIDPILTIPQDVTYNACSTNELADSTTLAFSTSEITLTLQQLQAAGGNASDNCGIESITYQDITDGNSCEQTITRSFTVTDSCGNSVTQTQTIVFEMPDFTMPANQDTTVNCIADAIQTTPITVTDYCGNNIIPTGPVVSDDPSCEGDKTYTWTYTDCASHSHQWILTYHINIADFTMPADQGTTVNCLSDITQPTPPTVIDFCGNTITPSSPVVSADPDCGGNKTFTWTYMDCAGNTHDWIYTYSFDDNTHPSLTIPSNASFEDMSVSDLTDSTGLAYNTVETNITLIQLQNAGGNASDNCNIASITYQDISELNSDCQEEITRTFKVTDDCGNTTQLSQIITITNDLNVTIQEAGPFCSTGDAIQLVVSPTGGTFSGTGVSATGRFNPANANIGNNTITYNYSDQNGCSGSDEITIEVIQSPDVFDHVDTFYCTEYILPEIEGENLTGNQVYSTLPFGQGDILPVGTAITTSQTIYIYDETGTEPNCFDQHGFIIDIYYAPELAEVEDQTACDSYTLPIIRGNNLTQIVGYYTEPNQQGTRMEPGDVITSSQMVYIYDRTGILMENCDDQDSFMVTIITSPDINDISDQNVCEYYVLPAITGSNLSGNESYYSQSGGTGTAYQAGDTIRTTQTIYIYDETGTSINCYDEESFTVTKLTEPTVSIDPAGPFCEDDDTYQLIASPSGGTFSGSGVTENGLFTPANANIGNNIISYTFSDNNECSGSAQITIVINEAPTVTLEDAGPYCEDADAVQLTGSPAGGTYSGTGVSATGLFTPANANIGNNVIIYTFTDGNGCTNSDQITIVVNYEPTVTLTEAGPFCKDADAVQLVGSPSGGTFSGKGVSLTGLFTPSSANIGNNTITYSFTNGNGCDGSDQITIVVNDLPLVSINPVGSYCEDANAVQLIGSPSGGSFSGTGVNATGLFTPTNANIGNNVITYTYTDNNGCTNSDQTTIVVNKLPIVTLNEAGPFCSDATAVQLVGSPSGGTYSGTGVSASGLFNPVNANIGNNVISYTYTDGNGCTNSDQITIVVNDEPTVTLTEAGPFCKDADAVQLVGSPSGGTFSGKGVSATGLFTPSSANIGNNTITYSFINGNGCDGSDEITIVVNQLPNVTINPAGPFCEDAGAVQLIGSPSGGTFSGTGVSVTGSFTPIDANIGNNIITYTYTDINGCTNSDETTIVVNELPTVTLTEAGPFCSDASAFQLVGSPTGGSFSGTGVSASGLFNPANANIGNNVITYTYTDGNSCTNSDQITIVVNDEPIVTLTEAGPFCKDADALQLVGSPSGGTFSGTGVSTIGLFTPSSANIGNNTINYSFINDNGCDGSDQITIVVNDLPSVSINPAGPFCEDANTVQLIGSPSGGSFSGTGVSATGSFTPGNANIGNNVITYTYTDGNGCTNSNQTTIVVNELPTVTLTEAGPFCSDAAAVQLVGLPSGGNYSGTGVSATGLFTPANANIGNNVIIYSYTDGNGCTDSDEITIKVIQTPDVFDLSDTTVCEKLILPPVPGENLTQYAGYFTAPNGGGTKYAPGTAITSTKRLYIYDKTNTEPNCTDQEDFMITVTSPEITLDKSNVLCNGGNTGKAWVNVSEGTPPYTYLWNDGLAQTTDTAFNLTEGWYTVTVTDANGCSAVDSIEVGESEKINFNLDRLDPLFCFGDSTFVWSEGIQGGTPPYKYSWDNGDTTRYTISKGGWSILTITDTNNCLSTDSIYLTFASEPFIASAFLIDSVDCYSYNSGSVQVTTSGGSGQEQYIWKDSSETIVGNSSVLENISKGWYFVEVKDIYRCRAHDSIFVSQPDQLIATATKVSPILCYGDSSAIATVSVEGGTAPYTYIWDDALNQTTDTAVGLAAGTYTVLVTDANGCEEEAQVNIPQPDKLTVSIKEKTDVNCYGTATGSATAKASGGTSPYNYFWNTVPQQTGATATGLIAGTYTVVVIDAKGCTDSIQVSIKGIEEDLLIDITHTNTQCPGDATGTATALVTGGTEPYNYSWNTSPLQDSKTATDLVAGFYTVIVTDANQCEATDTVTIIQKDTIPPSAICKNFTAYLDENGSVVVTGEDVDGGSYDNCSECCGITKEVFPSEFCCADVGDTMVYLVVTDKVGLKDTCEAIVTIKDGMDPVALCKDITVYLDDNGQYVLTPAELDDGSYDNCDSIRLEILPNILACDMVNPDEVPETVGLYVYDEAGNFDVCISDVTVLDTISPVVDCPNDFDIYRDTTCEFRIKDYTSKADATDNCKVERKTQTPAALTIIEGPTQVTIYAYDKSNNVDSCSFWVTPVDSVKPTVICPDDQLIPVDAECQFILTNYIDSAEISKHCQTVGDLTIIQSPDSGTVITQPTEVTISVTDEMGNFESCSFKVIPIDTTPPTIECPADITIECAVDVPDADTSLVTAFDNCDENLLIRFIKDQSDEKTCPETITRTYKAIDASGNYTTCNQIITINDTTKPSFTVPADITIYKDDTCGYNASVIFTGDVTDETDNCSTNLEATFEDEVIENEFCEGGTTIVRTWTLTDECGNTYSDEQGITIRDTTSPTFTVPEDITIYRDGNCEFDASVGVTGDVTDEADNCDSLLEATYEDDYSEKVCIYNKVITRTWSLTDDCENTTTRIQLIQVLDTIPPSIDCLAEGTLTKYVDENCQIELDSFFSMVNVSDNCSEEGSINVSQVPAPGSLISGSESPLQVWMYAEDNCGNVDSCSFIIELVDTIPPMVDCPENDSIPLNENCVAVLPDYTFEMLSDNCTDSTNITVEQTPTAGFTFTEETIVTLYATDEAGNVDSCSFNVTPYALDEDVVNCPEDTTIYVDENCEALIPALRPEILPASCTDVDAIYSWDQNPVAGTTVSIGNTVVTLNVYNEQILVQSCDVNISVVDTTIEIICPENQTLFASEECSAIVPDVTSEIEVVENCSPIDSIVITQSPEAGTTIGLGLTEVIVYATDLSGNTDSCNFNINVSDTLPPAIVCPDDQEVPLNEVCEIVIPDYASNVTISDNCSNDENIIVTQLPISGTVVSDTTEIVLTATDEAGNSESCSFIVIPTISDSTIVVCPEDITITANEDCQAIVPELLPEITFASCTEAENFSIEQSPAVGTVIGLGVTNVTVTVLEGEEIIETCEVEVTVVDEDIDITCPDDITLEVVENCSAIVPDLTQEVTIDENCTPQADVMVSQSVAAGTNIGIGTTTVTLTATDASGNSATCSVDIEVVDNVIPTIVCPEDVSAETLPGECEADVTVELPELDDNCPGVTATNDYNGTANASDSYPVGVTTITWTALDASGNTATCIMTVIVVGAPDAIDDSESTEKDTPVDINVLANDTDCDNNIDPTTVSIINNPTNGSVTVDPVTGEVTYTPDSGFDGTDVFNYQVCDADGLCDNADVTISIDNNPPIAQNDINVTTINTPVNGNVLTNDSDPDGDPLSINTNPVSGPTNGTVELNTDGTYTYTPATDYIGNDEFTYQVCDNGGLCDTAVVSISITDDSTPNNPPIAVNDNYTGVVNTRVSGDLLANDSDPDGDNISIVTSVVTVPSIGGGTLALNTDGTFRYTPPTGFVGIVTFEYEIYDDGTPELRDTALVTIEIFDHFVPNTTVAVDDFYSIHEGESVNGNASINDYDPEGDIQSFIKITDPEYGTVEFLADGTFTYTPNQGYVGPDNFVYETCDDNAQQACDRATVYVVVLSINNNPPIAENDINVTQVNYPVSGNVLTNDIDPDGDKLSVNPILISGPFNGTVVIDATGLYTYTPAPDYIGNDIFTYQVCDNGGLCDTADVSISITVDDENNNPPVAVNDNTSGKVNTRVSGDLLANDFDPDGDNITIVTAAVTPPSVNGGTLAINTDGTFRYTPPVDFTGTVTFEYEIYDDGNPSLRDTALVTINILGNPVNPENFTFAVDDVYYPGYDESVSSDVSINDYDPEGDNQSFTLSSNPVYGTVSFSADGKFTYTPSEGFVGTDSYTYTACDDGTPQACDVATVYIVYLEENNPPIAENDINSTLVDTPVNGNVITNDSDPDGDPILVSTTLVSEPIHGTVSISANGIYTYTPESGFIGNDEFVYSVCDNSGLCDQAIVSISIVERPEPGVNRPPVAVNDNTSGNVDTPVTGDLLSNDFDPDNDIITVITTPVTQPEFGSITINVDGKFTYVPEPGFTGIITFTYEIFDDGIPSLRDTATVTIRIEDIDAINTTYAVDDMYEANANGVIITGNVGDNDYDPEGDDQSFSLLDGPYHGTLVFTPDGGFTYEPNIDFVGSDSYTYMACDDGDPQACDIATVYILIEPELLQVDPPRAEDDTYTATCQEISGDVLSNDVYALDISVNVISDVSNGLLQFSSDGKFNYTPNQGFIGQDNFMYEICYTTIPDNCDTALVSINVEYDPVCFSDPTPQDDSYTTTCYTISGNVLDNDELDVADITTPTIVIGALYGVLEFNSDGTFEYTPDEGFVGIDSFQYEVCYDDYPDNCGSATAVINVEYDEACVPCSELFIPNAFSPNGDGVHDYFIVECIENLYPDAKLMIFNRWGNLVYEREHYGNTSIWDETQANWDGTSMHDWTVGDEKLPNGTYMYVLILDANTVKKGTVYLNY